MFVWSILSDNDVLISNENLFHSKVPRLKSLVPISAEGTIWKFGIVRMDFGAGI